MSRYSHDDTSNTGEQGLFNRRLVFCETMLLNLDNTGDFITSCPDCFRFFAICCPHSERKKLCHHYQLVFTDGACLSNGQRSAMAGIGAAIGGDPVHQLAMPVDDTLDPGAKKIEPTSRAAGRYRGLHFVSEKDHDHLHGVRVKRQSERAAWIITTDSEYVVKGMTEWFPAWKANGWRASGGSRPSNLDLFQKLDGAITAYERKYPVQVAFWHVTREYNTLADSLAKRGAKSAPLVMEYLPSAQTSRTAI